MRLFGGGGVANVVPKACLCISSIHNACGLLRRLKCGTLSPQLLDYGLESGEWEGTHG
jgi:hypothetical protein